MDHLWQKATRTLDGVLRVEAAASRWTEEEVVVEEPLEIRLVFGEGTERREKSISITMRTPGHDEELAVGFLLTEGVIRDVDAIESVEQVLSSQNAVRVLLAPNVEVNQPSLERNFYTTSGCGICGKASLLALETIAPPRRRRTTTITADVIRSLPATLRARQGLFERTGGLHGAAVATSTGELLLWREDIGRHNAVDKLLGAALMEGHISLHTCILVLSSRVSFDLMQKAILASIGTVVAIGAPSSLAVDLARRFDVTLIAFVRDDHFNVYNGYTDIPVGEPL